MGATTRNGAAPAAGPAADEPAECASDGAARFGAGSGVFRRAHQGQGLHGLAQAHVVGQHTAEAVAVQEAEPVEAFQLVRAQLGVQRLGQGKALDAAFQQAAHGLAPRRGLFVDDPEVCELVPQSCLEAADLQRGVFVAGVVLQGAGLVDQRPQLVQLRQVQREVRPAGQQHAGLPGSEGRKQRREGNRLPLQSDDDAQIEPVAAVRRLGGDCHHRGFFGFAVVSNLAGGIHGDVAEVAEPGKHVLGEGERVQAGQFCRCRQARRAPAAGRGFAQCRHNIPGLPHALEDARLGGVVPVAMIARMPPQRLRRDEVPGLVVPFPVQPDPVVRPVVGQQGQGGDRKRGQFHRLVGGGNPGGLLQLGVKAGQEAAFVPGGDMQRGPARDEGQQFLAETAFQRGKGDDGVGGGDAGQGVAVGSQEDPVRRAADGPDRRRIHHLALDRDGRSELEPAVLPFGADPRQVQPDGGRLLNQPHRLVAAAVDQRDADLLGLGQQAPQVLAGVGVQPQPQSGAGMLAVRHGGVRGEEFLHPLHMRLVAFAAVVQVAQRAPGDIAADPLALGPHDDGACLQLADAAERIAAARIGEVRGGFLDVELERQRGAVGGRRDPRMGDQGAKGLLPVGHFRRCALAGQPRALGGGQQLQPGGRVVFGREEQGRHVLAVLADRAAADSHRAAPAARFPDKLRRRGIGHVGTAPHLAQQQAGGGVEGDPGNAAPHGVGESGRKGAVVDRGGLNRQCRTLVRMGWHVRATFGRWSSDPSYRAFAGPGTSPAAAEPPPKLRLTFN